MIIKHNDMCSSINHSMFLNNNIENDYYLHQAQLPTGHEYYFQVLMVIYESTR